MYVDESGDPGNSQYSSPHFILSGLIIYQDDWKSNLEQLKILRSHLKKTYNLNRRTEIHASEIFRVQKIEEYKRIRKSDRIKLLKEYIYQIPVIFNNAKILNICIDKQQHQDKDIFNLAWKRLIQRYEIYLKNMKDKGIIIADDTDSKKLMALQRQMRVYNPLPSSYNYGYYNAPIERVLEDTFARSSTQSYFIQTIDVVTHILYRKEYPKGSLKKHGIERLFDVLEPILLKEASRNDTLGIVRR